MKDLSEIKNAVLSSIGKAADAGKDIANKAADKAKSGARIAKLSMEIAGEKENMKKAYIEIGKLYYDTHKDDPEGFFIQLCEEVGLAQKNIADKESEIESLKSDENVPVDVEIDIEFEKVVAEDEEAAAAETDTPAPEAAEPEAPSVQEDEPSDAE